MNDSSASVRATIASIVTRAKRQCLIDALIFTVIPMVGGILIVPKAMQAQDPPMSYLVANALGLIMMAAMATFFALIFRRVRWAQAVAKARIALAAVPDEEARLLIYAEFPNRTARSWEQQNDT